MRFKSINNRILAMILPVVFISTISLVLISYFASISRINNETEQKIFALLDTEAVRIQDELNRNTVIAQGLASYASTTRRSDFISGAFSSFMAHSIPTNENTIGGGIWFEPYYLDEDIKYFGPYYYHETDEYVLTYMYSNDAYDYPNTLWYRNGKNATGPIAWTDVYYDDLSGITMLTGAVPFYGEEGAFAGVCTADMAIEDIRQFINGIRVGDTGRAFLLGTAGNYISFRESNKTLDMIMTEDSDANLAALGSEIMANDRGVSTVVRDGVARRVFYQTVPGVEWKLGISIEESEISKPAGSLLFVMLAITLLALAATTIAVMLLARHLRGIIDKVNTFSHLAAEGQLEERIHLDVQDEFGSIADNLNIMMENMGKMSRAKGDFLSRMSHEIRTPMNAIVGMAQIAKNAESQAKVDNCLQKIEESSKHLLGIINDILDYSKVEAGKLTLDEAFFSLTENMDFVISMLKNRAQDKDIELALTLRHIEHDGIFTDVLRLNQVLINLLSNAVKFTDAGGRIEVIVEEHTHENGRSVYNFCVRDNGIGIAPDQVQKIFSPFVQADARISSRYGGTGLGLVISKNIVEMLGGELTVQSVPGEGSAFSFDIHVQAQAEAESPYATAQADASETLPDLAGKHLMIVDDIQINREIMLELLKSTGATMDTAENGRDALDIFRNSPLHYYDLILMDMQMPVMDGCSATREIRETGRPDAGSVRIIAMTANVMQEDVQRTRDAGMDGHIGKPINMKEVAGLLQGISQGGEGDGLRRPRA